MFLLYDAILLTVNKFYLNKYYLIKFYNDRKTSINLGNHKNAKILLKIISIILLIKRFQEVVRSYFKLKS